MSQYCEACLIDKDLPQIGDPDLGVCDKCDIPTLVWTAGAAPKAEGEDLTEITRQIVMQLEIDGNFDRVTAYVHGDDCTIMLDTYKGRRFKLTIEAEDE